MRYLIASFLPYLFLILLIISFILYKYAHKLSAKLRVKMPTLMFLLIIVPFIISITWTKELQRSVRATVMKGYKEHTKTSEEFSDEYGELIPYITYTTTDPNEKLKENVIQCYLMFQLIGIPLIILRLANKTADFKNSIN